MPDKGKPGNLSSQTIKIQQRNAVSPIRANDDQQDDPLQSAIITPATHDQILATISSASALLLRSADIEENITGFLASLGNVIGTSFCFLFNFNLDESNPRFKITNIWKKSDIIDLDFARILDPHLIWVRQSNDGFFLESTHSIDIPASITKISIAILPLNHTDSSRGYLGLMGTDSKQVWSPSLRDALRISANLIGAILDRNRFEERYKENEIRNRVIIDALPDLVIRIDITGKILDYTARKDHPLYINRDSITGKMLSDIWPKNIVRKIIHTRKNSRVMTQHVMEEFRLPFSDKVYESRLDPIGSQEALIVIRDITEQAELRQMKSDFINQASHELRTPVTSAILMAELIQEGGLPREIEEYWQILNSELNRQKILIDRLLIAGRLESGMMQLESVPTNLTSILNESISAVLPIARKKNINISLSLPENLSEIFGDKSGLQQVFINLINNAIKFSPEGSSVKVIVTQISNFVDVAVIDQGMGIPANQTSHLFERFFRARDVTIAEIPGSGVGLYIVKSILEGIGGSIALTNSSSAGTTFTARLRKAG
jgi:signal transduction histidine kinase